MRASKHLVVLTGAGVSADSGVRTFRDAGGLWEGHRMEEVATPEAWARDPRLVWRFYQLRRAQLAEVQPNAAHLALAELERALTAAGHRFTLISQNVDNLHQRAGSTVLAMHGQLSTLRCEVCAHRFDDLVNLDPERFIPCPACGHARVRPDIVWFGEVPYFVPDIEAVLQTATEFIAIGTSGVVYPAAGFLRMARMQGAKTWVNSLDRPDNLHPRDEFLPGPAAQVIPAWVLAQVAAC